MCPPVCAVHVGVCASARAQVDMRAHNSWTMRLHEVSTPELAEVLCFSRGPCIVCLCTFQNDISTDRAPIVFFIA